MKKVMILAALMMAVGSSAYAQRRGSGGNGVYLGIGAMYDNTKVTADMGGTETESKMTQITLDGDLGYVFSSGLYLGAAYISTSSDDGTNKPKDSALGVGLGYMKNGFIGKLSYYLSGQTESGTEKGTEGTGLGVDVGYLFPVSSSFNMGASLAYRDIKYKKIESSGVEVPDASVKSSTLSPRLLFAFTF
ncbi:MAG TPA: hypothetical protein PL182_11720 [Pseudobdellovibrionaceae bacterium]|nr:hypothetical protein [Pseudobdellovibrionaceae bacterium]